MTSKKILLVEDDLKLQNLVDDYLKEYGFLCSSFENPIEALEEYKINSNEYSLAILDLGLPLMDGFDLLKKLKEIKPLPVIISTARDDIGNKIYGYELGIDDYLSKPYEPRELVLRINAVLKRFENDDFYNVNDFKIDKKTNQIFLNKKEIELTKIEAQILILLLNNPNKVISREEIIRNSSLKEDTRNRTIDMHISNIRYKTEDDSKNTKYIKSVWGIGYKFIDDN